MTAVRKEQGKLRRALAAVSSWLQAMTYSGFDYTMDRIEGLEREVRRLKEELRQTRDPEAVEAHKASAIVLDPTRQHQ